MFRIDNEYDFDDDLLDISSNETRSELENNQKNLKRNDIESVSDVSNLESNLFGSTDHGHPKRNAEFLNFWDESPANQSCNSFKVPNQTELITKHVRKTIRQRKFPGPAGLLPERLGNTSLVATDEFLEELNTENEHSSDFKEKEILSQSSGRIFESGAWSALMDDLGTSGQTLTSLMNLASLRLKHTRGYKVPFLACVVNHIDCTLPDPTVIVKDLTDEMHGMLHRDVWEQFNTEIVPGSVFVLKNVGVISAGTTSRRHILNITANNLTAIYSSREEDHIQIRKISELPTGDHSLMLAEWKKVITAPMTPSPKQNIIKTPPLFNSHPSCTVLSRNNVHQNNFSSTPIKPKPYQKLSKPNYLAKPNSQSSSFRLVAPSTSSDQPAKKHKPSNFGSMKLDNESRKQTTPFSNTFQIDSDTSIVDSLLDGVDTNSLFEEF